MTTTAFLTPVRDERQPEGLLQFKAHADICVPDFFEGIYCDGLRLTVHGQVRD